MVIASSSSWKLRTDQTIYTAVKAAQATFVRNLATEFQRDRPDSKILLVNPGGLKTPHFHKDFNYDIGQFLDPDLAAGIIWNKVVRQTSIFKEIQILRQKGDAAEEQAPIIIDGPVKPEVLC